MAGHKKKIYKVKQKQTDADCNAGNIQNKQQTKGVLTKNEGQKHKETKYLAKDVKNINDGQIKKTSKQINYHIINTLTTLQGRVRKSKFDKKFG